MSEVETSRMSLVSRTQFKVLGLEGQVLGLGLEACKSSKMPCPRLVESTIFWFVDNGPRSWRLFFRVKTRQRPCGKFLKTFFSCFFLRERLNFAKNLRFFELRHFLENAWISWKIYDFFREDFFFFWRTLARCVFSLGLEHSCPRKVGSWPRIFLCPWPRALCPRLHLCKICLIWIHFRKEEIYNIRLSFFKIPCK